MANSVQLIAFRSKKSGRFFKFSQYCDDGWGKLEATESMKYTSDSDGLPTFYSPYAAEHKSGIPEFDKHDWKDVEAVKFTLTMEES